jgi:hypothetical protein
MSRETSISAEVSRDDQVDTIPLPTEGAIAPCMTRWAAPLTPARAGARPGIRRACQPIVAANRLLGSDERT